MAAWRLPQLLINSASLYDQAPILSTNRSTLEREFAVNFFAPFDLIRAFAATRQPGQVINILDNKIAFAQFQYAAYLLSKKALAELTRIAALEFAPVLRVNGIAPGVVLPARERSAGYLVWREQGIPLRRQGQISEITRGLDYLVQNEFLTGQILFIDGGESLGATGRNAADFSQRRSRVVVAVGSNIQPEENIRLAAELLARESTLLDQAALIRTEPDGYRDQADFLNGAFLIETELEHDDLRAYLKSLEVRLGRVKGPIKAGPRTIDLDIILWDGAVLDGDYFHKHYIKTPVREIVDRNRIEVREARG